MNGTNINWDMERTAFEHWFVRTQTNNNRTRVVSKLIDGTYVDGVVRGAWRAWRQAIQRGADGKASLGDKE